jgi:hypothetical protein
MDCLLTNSGSTMEWLSVTAALDVLAMIEAA